MTRQAGDGLDQFGTRRGGQRGQLAGVEIGFDKGVKPHPLGGQRKGAERQAGDLRVRHQRGVERGAVAGDAILGALAIGPVHQAAGDEIVEPLACGHPEAGGQGLARQHRLFRGG